VKNSTEALANYSDGRLGDETKRQEANAAHTMIQAGFSWKRNRHAVNNTPRSLCLVLGSKTEQGLDSPLHVFP
jgi:hypothetical protein